MFSRLITEYLLNLKYWAIGLLLVLICLIELGYADYFGF